ncbi:MAG TPA: HEAT repeat domain-containing protein [Pyrinomonadaceae bacterium]|nr:HEAT repeat domain-containing protein [Pyrinomonadaceae bacterium]
MNTNHRDNTGIGDALEILTHTSQEVRQGAVARAADTPESFGPAFFEAIYKQIDDPTCKWYAIRSLGDLEAKEYLGVLIDVLKSPDVEVGKSSLHLIAAHSIGQIGSEAIESLLLLLDSAHGSTAIGVVDALGEVRATEAVPALKRSLESADRKLALWSALSLAKIGRPSIPALHGSLSHADISLTAIIVDALAIINEPEIMPGLAQAASIFDSTVKRYILDGPRHRVHGLISLARNTANREGSIGEASRQFLHSFRHEIQCIEDRKA